MKQYSNAFLVVHQFLKSLKVKHSKVGLSQTLVGHPDFPSMMAISDCLTEWRVANEANVIPKENYKDLEVPFIAHFAENGGNIILINSTTNGSIGYFDGRRQNSSMSENEFLKKWNGIVLRAEADEDSGEAEYNQNRWKDLFQILKIPMLFTILLVGIGIRIYALFPILTLPYYTQLVINILGVVITSLLLVSSVDNNNYLVQNLCSLGSKNGCNAILKTDASKLTNWLSWSEIGFIYFTGGLLSLLITPSSLFLIAGFNLLAMPYTVYSITYQYRHKNWCALCCMVQGLLILGCINVLVFKLWFFSFNNVPISAFYLVPFSFLLPITIWYILKPFFEQAVQFQPLKQQLNKFKYNSDLFDKVLKNQPCYAVSNELMPIVLGNPQADTVITMVSNPFCAPCAKAHRTIDEWLKYREDIQLKIIFTTADHEDDDRTKVSRHISALTTLNNAQLVEDALNDWYMQKTKQYNDWAVKYPVNFDTAVNGITEKQKQWCEMAEISFTPTILVNGYKLPEPYTLEDIKYLIT
ncbi:thioredoxin domain-containing protein [Pedobacter sp. KLB.chiD]|uniref:thioredoxin domain-containing protein n=1 Tax=Pedobacter sp. KLB.chiD TaxID=3387402 RepID=UPI00399AB73F